SPAESVSPAESASTAGQGSADEVPSESPTSNSQTDNGEESVAGISTQAAYTCNPADVYYTVSQQIWKYDAASGNAASVKTYSSGFPDALAVDSSGYIYVMMRTQTSPANILRIDPTTGDQITLTGSTLVASGNQWVAGAVNPVNGFYYYADSVGYVYAYDTQNEKAIGFIGKLTPSVVTQGDLAFDDEGNLYSYWAKTNVAMVSAMDVPTENQPASTKLQTSAAGSAKNDFTSGLAWMSEETSRPLWSIRYSNTQNDLGIRTILGQTPPADDQQQVFTLPAPAPGGSNGYIYDMASCAAPAGPSLSLSKNVVGRVDAGDQFTLSVKDSAGAELKSATTTGTSNGVQSAKVGRVSVEAGQTFTLQETATANLGEYTKSASCTTSEGEAVPTTGSNGTYQVTIPDDVTGMISCEIKNVAPATISVTKTLSNSRFAASDQFTVQVRTGDANGAVLDTPGNETTVGTGNAVNSGTGTTGKARVDAGSQYTITEKLGAGVDGANYESTITCTDATSTQSGLPDGKALGAGFSLTPTPGAQISCTIDNKATKGAGVGIGEGLTCETGYVYGIASTNPTSNYRQDSYGYVYKI
ncbi:FctA domain-containing protein, partial [Brooklawnia sp.]|uniref:Spy0128 family protein n=1 Tax=Brooklawnia sp. TaxID=2699740 RepID=UPI00311FCBD5